MNITSIRNEKDYQNALNRLEDTFDAKKETEQAEELEVLSILIDNYETRISLSECLILLKPSNSEWNKWE